MSVSESFQFTSLNWWFVIYFGVFNSSVNTVGTLARDFKYPVIILLNVLRSHYFFILSKPIQCQPNMTGIVDDCSDSRVTNHSYFFSPVCDLQLFFFAFVCARYT